MLVAVPENGAEHRAVFAWTGDYFLSKQPGIVGTARLVDLWANLPLSELALDDFSVIASLLAGRVANVAQQQVLVLALVWARQNVDAWRPLPQTYSDVALLDVPRRQVRGQAGRVLRAVSVDAQARAGEESAVYAVSGVRLGYCHFPAPAGPAVLFECQLH